MIVQTISQKINISPLIISKSKLLKDFEETFNEAIFEITNFNDITIKNTFSILNEETNFNNFNEKELIEIANCCDFLSVDNVEKFYDTMYEKIKKIKFENTSIMSLIEKYPQKNWDWSMLSYDNNITLKFISEHIHFPWKFSSMTHREDLTIKFIRDHLHDNNYWNRIYDKKFCIETILENIDLNWDWNEIFKDKYISLINLEKIIHLKNLTHCPRSIFFNKYYDDNEEKTYKNWCDMWSYISSNRNLNMEFIEKYKNNIDYGTLSSNHDIVFSLIENNLLLQIDYVILSRNKNITLAFVKKYTINREAEPYQGYGYYRNNGDRIYKSDWDFDYISQYFTDIENIVNPEYSDLVNKLNWEKVSWNLNLTFEFIIKNLNLPWSWKHISSNRSISSENILSRQDLPWNWYSIVFKYKKKSDKVKFIDKFYHKITDWNFLKYPTIIFDEMYERCIDHVDFKYMHDPATMLGFSHYTRLSEKFVENHHELIMFKYISYENLSIQFIEKFIDKDWDFNRLSYNKNISLQFMRKYNNKPWKTTKIQIIQFYTDCPIDIFKTYDSIYEVSENDYGFNTNWEYISAFNKNINIKIVKDNKNLLWNYKSLQHNPKLIFKNISENLDLPWTWNTLGIKIYGIEHYMPISSKDIGQFMDKDWNYNEITSNLLKTDTINFLHNYYTNLGLNCNVTQKLLSLYDKKITYAHYYNNDDDD